MAAKKGEWKRMRALQRNLGALDKDEYAELRFWEAALHGRLEQMTKEQDKRILTGEELGELEFLAYTDRLRELEDTFLHQRPANLPGWDDWIRRRQEWPKADFANIEELTSAAACKEVEDFCEQRLTKVGHYKWYDEEESNRRYTKDECTQVPDEPKQETTASATQENSPAKIQAEPEPELKQVTTQKLLNALRERVKSFQFDSSDSDAQEKHRERTRRRRRARRMNTEEPWRPLTPRRDNSPRRAEMSTHTLAPRLEELVTRTRIEISDKIQQIVKLHLKRNLREQEDRLNCDPRARFRNNTLQRDIRMSEDEIMRKIRFLAEEAQRRPVGLWRRHRQRN